MDQNNRQRQPRAATIDYSDLARSPSFLLQPKPRAAKRHSLPLRKNVQFSSMSDLLIFEHPAPNTWYTQSDYHRFKEELKMDVLTFRFRHESPSPSDTGSCCPVGIEQHIFNQDRLNVYSARRFVIQSVLHEQDHQRVLGYRDPDEIASLAEQLSTDASDGALMRGKFQELFRLGDMEPASPK